MALKIWDVLPVFTQETIYHVRTEIKQDLANQSIRCSLKRQTIFLERPKKKKRLQSDCTAAQVDGSARAVCATLGQAVTKSISASSKENLSSGFATRVD